MSQKLFEDFGKIIVRLPLQTHTILFENKEETKNLDELIRIFSQDAQFLESIHWSSPLLYKTIQNFKNKEFSEKKKNKIALTLKKYLIRTSTRSTPYGTFAGTAIQNFTESNFCDIKIRKKLRLDVGIIRKIIQSIENNATLSPYLHYSVNNTLYSFNNEFRYLEIDKNDERSIQISSYEKNEILKFLYNRHRKEKITLKILIDNFSYKFEKENLVSFFRDLAESGFLISELELSLGNNDVKTIIKFLNQKEFENSKEAFPYKKLFNDICFYISKEENLALNDFKKSEYDAIFNQFNNIGIILKDEPIFHVDVLSSPIENFKISNKDFKHLEESISVLSAITLPEIRQTEIQKFQKFFTEKYDARSVSLMEILDPEIGLGFPVNENIGNFSDNNFISLSPKHYPKSLENKGNISEWLTDKIENLSPKQTEIKINQQDVANLKDRINTLPYTFNIVGQKIGEETMLLQNVSGPHAHTLISRFGYMHNEIGNLCKEISTAEKEFSNEVIFAEIIWFPPGKEANVTRKSHYSEYEIPLYYEGCELKKNQITVDDIWVSINNNEVILHSKKLKKRIIPRLSSAHNYQKDYNPVYRFLCSLQDQSSLSLTLQPDFQYSKKRFFPRISYKNVILHQACWILQHEDIRLIKNSEIPSEELKKIFKKWNTQQYVLLCQGDNELLLDTYNYSYLEILLNEIKTETKTILLKEWLYKHDDQINQFILPLKKKQHIPFKGVSGKYIENFRTFLPGDQWLYFKIYCNANSSDTILKSLNSQLKKLEKTGMILQWFFIRYMDPHYHLRLRIQLKSDNASHEIITLINNTFKNFLRKKIIWKIMLDTYESEVSRYSAYEIENVEYVFYKDSCLVAQLLKNDEFLNSMEIRVFAAIKNLDSWLDLFSLDLNSKIKFCEAMKNSFLKEQSADFIQQSEKKYREHQEIIFSFLKSKKFVNLFESRNKALKSLHLNSENLQDFIHMSLNRFFVTNQRNWEFLVYSFCLKYYNKCYFISSQKNN